MDRYDERLVKAKTEAGTVALFILSIIITIGAIALIFLIPLLGLLVLTIGVVMFWFTKDGLKIEYEYTIVNGDITIDKILNAKRRKEMTKIPSDKIKRVEYADNAQVKNDLSLGKIPVKRYVGKEPEILMAVYADPEGKDCIYVLDLNEKCVDHLMNKR